MLKKGVQAANQSSTTLAAVDGGFVFFRMMRQQYHKFAIGKGFGQTRRPSLVIAERDNMGRNIADNAQEILSWVAQPDVVDLRQVR